MKAPIIVDENGDVRVFDSVEAAEFEMEAIDVIADEYRAYDSEGTVLEVRAATSDGPVRIRPRTPNIKQADVLIRILTQFVLRVGPHRFATNAQQLKSISLGRLVGLVRRGARQS